VNDASPNGRSAALSAAVAVVDAELENAAVDDHFALTLRACAGGGHAALSRFCAVVEGSKEAGELPALALVEALDDDDAALRAVRAVAWVMTAQRVASAWPATFYGAFEVARVAMPLSVPDFEHMQALGALTACANTTDDPDIRDGQRMQFSRESLEHVIGAATVKRPVRRDMLHVIAPWTSCFLRGVKVCDEHLRELEALHPDVQPAPEGPPPARAGGSRRG
jgi:hypothetical protein